jgi:hypothetical protein
VPAGFDVVHFLVQAAFKDKATAPAAVYAVRAVSGPALQRWCHDSEQVEATILLYLCEILARYVADGGADPAPVLQARISMISAMLTEFTGVTAIATEESHVDA